MTPRLWAKDLPLDELVHRYTVGDDPAVDPKIVPYDCVASAAHARMLAAVGLLSAEQAHALCAELRTLHAEAEAGRFIIAPELEDGHTAIEVRLVAALGETGKRIHLGRSRNDQVLAALRLYMLAELHEATVLMADLGLTLMRQAMAHRGRIMPGYTHLRRAMPTSVDAWLVAYAEGLAAGIDEARTLKSRLSPCPLGAAAGFGTTLPIRPELTAEYLSGYFEGVHASPVFAQATRGLYEARLVGFFADTLNGLEKLMWDLSLYSTEEFGFVKIPDAFTTGSSIMPQKRNPDGLELARAAAREMRGLRTLVESVATGLPGNYHRDLQRTKKPLVEAVALFKSTMAVLDRIVGDLGFDTARMEAACSDDLFATHEAYRLVTEAEMPFRDAYREIARRIADGSYTADRERATPPLIAQGVFDRLNAVLGAAHAGIGPDADTRASIATRLWGVVS